jgi:hypothetical protein
VIEPTTAVLGVGAVAEDVPPEAFVPHQFRIPPALAVADNGFEIAF